MNLNNLSETPKLIARSVDDRSVSDRWCSCYRKNNTNSL